MGIVVLLWIHGAGIVGYAGLTGQGWLHGVAEATPVAGAAIVARWSWCRRGTRSGAATVGLVTCSAILVHLSGGVIEAHFHFFVVVGVIALYQDWFPFSLALSYVVLQHGVFGALQAASVYNHSDAVANPWKWAAIHGAFVLAASAAHLTTWRLSEEGFQDTLTKLANRRLFEDRLGHALQRAQRSATRITVLFLDLDDFKTVNDSLGHAAGDQLLMAVADRIQNCLRPSDTVARFGGDEFAILLDGVDDEGASIVAQRILGAVRAPVVLHGRELFTTASIGIAGNLVRQDGDAILRDADAAMYDAKRNGKARFHLFEETMHGTVLKRLELRGELERAVHSQEFTVFYQPTVELATGKMIGVEALVRWIHPERGIVSPLDFIPLAEETGLIVPIGRWVLVEACRQVAAWNRQLPPSEALTASVNLSARQLYVPSLVADIALALSDSGLDPRQLVLEITESVLAHDPDAVIAKLHEIKALGVRLAIDDFGTGYSSLSYLHRFPIDVLKVDKSFIDSVGQTENATLARAIVALGPALGLEVVAEGVETAEQVRALQGMECGHAQGYFFARPMDAGRLEDLLFETGSRPEAQGKGVAAGRLLPVAGRLLPVLEAA